MRLVALFLFIVAVLAETVCAGEAHDVAACILELHEIATEDLENAHTAHHMARVDEILVQMDHSRQLTSVWPEIKGLDLWRSPQSDSKMLDRMGRFMSLSKECAKKINISALSNAYWNMARRLELVSSRIMFRLSTESGSGSQIR